MPVHPITGEYISDDGAIAEGVKLMLDLLGPLVEPAKVDRLIPEIIRHERCHIQIKAVTGSAVWHP